MKLYNDKETRMEVLYPGNLALLSMFLKKPESEQSDLKNKGDGSDCADVLTCGSCQKDFLLADILRFIQHKVHCQVSHGGAKGDSDSPEEDNDSPQKPTNPHDRNGDNASRTGGDTPPLNPPTPESVVKEEEEGSKTDEKRKREAEEDSPPSARKKARSVQYAEANTNNSEPARYVCGTCGSVLNTAWGLVQHVQSSHGIIIYQESNCPFPNTSTPSTPPGVPKPSHSSPLSSVSSTATTHSAPMPPLPLPLLDPTKMDLSKMVSPATSGATPLPPHPPVTTPLLDPTHPFNLLRMPLGDARVPFHPGLAPPFVRPGHDFRMDQLLQEGLRLNSGLLPPTFDRQPFLDPGLGAPRLSAPTPLNVGGDPNLDFYSQRLRQLAGTTSPTSSTSPKKAHPTPTPPPPFASPNGLASSNSAPAQTPTSTRNDSINALSKHFRCEKCAKTFRWESNYAIHMRVHTGEIDFRCTKCQEVVNSAHSLRIHMKSHKKSSDQNGTSPDSSRPQTEDDQDDDIEDEEEEEDDDDEDTNPSVTDSMDDEEEQQQYENMDEGPEDLSTSKSSLNETPTSQNVSSSTTTEANELKNMFRGQPKSVVGELMDKFGLANISAYSEAYQQALKESGRFISQSVGRDRNMVLPNKNGMDKSLRLREDLTKGIMASQPSIDLAHQTLLGAFDSPYDVQKRLNAVSRDSSGLYAGLWLPNLAGSGTNPRDIFPGIPHSDSNYINRKLINDIPVKTNESNLGIQKPGNCSSNATSMSLIPQPKKERGRNDTCEYCGKIFKNCSNLTVHRRSHTGEKPYKCDLCSYACAQSSKLTRHMKTHGRIGKDVYRCRFCDMPFSVASTLEKHMRKCVVNQNSKGIFPPISLSNDSMDSSYKGFHLNSVIKDESSKAGVINRGMFSPNSVAGQDGLETTYKGFHFTSVIKDDTSKPVGIDKGLFPPISAANQDNMETTYKGFHLTSVIEDDSSKSGGIFSSHFKVASATAAVASVSNDDTGDSSNLSSAAS